MQNVMVDTTGALPAAGQRARRPSARLKRRIAATKTRRNSPRRVSRSRPVGEGAAFGPPFCRLSSVRNSLSRPAPPHEAEPSETERHHGPGRGLRNPGAKAELECILR